jgi:hypothetical protein
MALPPTTMAADANSSLNSRTHRPCWRLGPRGMQPGASREPASSSGPPLNVWPVPHPHGAEHRHGLGEVLVARIQSWTTCGRLTLSRWAISTVPTRSSASTLRPTCVEDRDAADRETEVQPPEVQLHPLPDGSIRTAPQRMTLWKSWTLWQLNTPPVAPAEGVVEDHLRILALC